MNVGSVAFTWPAAFALLPLGVGFLVYVYRKRRPPDGTRVGTLFILGRLPRSSPRSRGFLPPLQFWIDLLIISGIITALSRPSVEKGNHRVALLVDNSLSMGATPVPNGETFLARALEAARHALNSASSNYDVTVYTVAPALRRLTQQGASPAEAAKVLESIQVQYAADSIPQQTERLLRSGEFDGVWVYTDQGLSKAPHEGGSSGMLTAVNVRDEVKEGIISNVSLSGLRGRVDNGSITVLGTVSNFSPKAVTGRVSFKTFDSGTGDNIGLQNVPFSVQPGGEAEFSIKPQNPNWTYGRAEISTDRVGDGTSTDLLALDNRAWVTRGSALRSIRLVGPLSPAKLNIEGLLGLSFEWDPNGNSPVEKSGAVIYHRVSPREPLRGPALLVYPGDSTIDGVGTIGSEIAAPLITRWQESHPITSYLNFQTLKIPKARTIGLTSGALSIVSTDRGSVLAAGETPDGRVAVSGLEIFPFSKAENPALSILTLNLLKWVFSSDRSSAAITTYTAPSNMKAGSTIRYLDSAKTESPMNLEADAPLEFPGVAQIGEAYVAVQFQSTEELDLRRVRNTTLSPTSVSIPGASQRPATSDMMLKWFAMALLGILGLDLILRAIRRASMHRSPSRGVGRNGR